MRAGQIASARPDRYLSLRAIYLLALALAALLAPPGIVQAGPIRECSNGLGGAYRNVTSRNVPCPTANRIAARIQRRAIQHCGRTELTLGNCRWRSGPYTVRGQWFKDKYGNNQIDLRATATKGRVVRLQTDFDGL